VLVNPATSFANSPWPQAGPLLTQLPPEVYRLLPFALSPVLCDPLAMARHAVDVRAALPTQASDYLYVSADCFFCVLVGDGVWRGGGSGAGWHEICCALAGAASPQTILLQPLLWSAFPKPPPRLINRCITHRA
jgi:hypothetical protein